MPLKKSRQKEPGQVVRKKVEKIVRECATSRMVFALVCDAELVREDDRVALRIAGGERAVESPRPLRPARGQRRGDKHRHAAPPSGPLRVACLRGEVSVADFRVVAGTSVPFETRAAQIKVPRGSAAVLIEERLHGRLITSRGPIRGPLTATLKDGWLRIHGRKRIGVAGSIRFVSAGDEHAEVPEIGGSIELPSNDTGYLICKAPLVALEYTATMGGHPLGRPDWITVNTFLVTPGKSPRWPAWSEDRALEWLRKRPLEAAKYARVSDAGNHLPPTFSEVSIERAIRDVVAAAEGHPVPKRALVRWAQDAVRQDGVVYQDEDIEDYGDDDGEASDDEPASDNKKALKELLELVLGGASEEELFSCSAARELAEASGMDVRAIIALVCKEAET